MSSQTKTTATKEEATPALVPKLRFPEFRGAKGWKPSVLADACDMQAGKFVSASNISERNQAGMFPCYGGNGLRGYTTTHTHDGTYPLIGRQGALCGNVRLAGGQFHATEHAVVATPKKAIDVVWLRYSLDLLNLNRFATGQAQPGLSVDVLENVVLAIPPLEPEQQKIAECLSSVDELIAAQARKVDALKTHKKGLMQQLFPREGETQPRLRFPEFQNAGEWEVRTIGEMFSLINGCAFKPEDWKPTGTPIIRIQNLNDPSAEFNYSQEPVPERNRVEPGDLLFAWSGTLGSSFGARIWNGPSGVLNQHIFKVLMDEQQITLQFALLVLARVEEEIARRTHGFKASFVHVKKSDLVQVEMLLPSVPEQQHIASCLSSLDAMITAETQKHEALKTHKKGLMQQLFPSPEEVAA
jgi:type I restriction enzyme S subunit